MDSNYSNYDMFDQLIANNRKAKSWTAFWVCVLCLLAGVVIVLAVINSKQKKTIADLSINADYKTRIIDSLKSVIQKEVDKKVDSISDYISNIDKSIQTIENASNGSGIANMEDKAQQKNNFVKVNNTIRELNVKVQQIKSDFRKDRLRFFIQYNNKADAEHINSLMNYLKKSDNNFIAPAELVDKYFVNIIKVYNYDNDTEEKKLQELVTKILGLPKLINLSHSSGSNVTKPTIEIWIGNMEMTQAQQTNAPAKY